VASERRKTQPQIALRRRISAIKKQTPQRHAATMLRTAKTAVRRLVGHSSAIAIHSLHMAAAPAPNKDQAHHANAVIKMSPVRNGAKEVFERPTQKPCERTWAKSQGVSAPICCY
jgi:hypothetical protein